MKTKTVFVCGECGYESAKWYGKCPNCGEWNSMAEQVVQSAKNSKATPLNRAPRGEVVSLDKITTQDELRFDTGMSELDRVLGGGAVKGLIIFYLLNILVIDYINNITLLVFIFEKIRTISPNLTPCRYITKRLDLYN